MRGDVFIARTFDNEDDFKRLDFSVSEVSSRAAWIREAAAQNARKQSVSSPSLPAASSFLISHAQAVPSHSSIAPILQHF